MQSDPENFFKNMYGNTPNIWREELSSQEKIIFSINAFTRMRCLNKDQSLDFTYNGTLNNLPAHLKPWFSFKSKFKRDKKIISGDCEKIKTVYDTWVFSRDLKSNNPNWLLIDTLT